jgi:hypothetical protein
MLSWVHTDKCQGRYRDGAASQIVATIILIGAIATTGYSQPGAMTPDQMKTMADQMKAMSDQMRRGKMAPDQMKMMGGTCR